MRCKACDRALEAGEIHWSSEHNDWDLCGRCKSKTVEAYNYTPFIDSCVTVENTDE